MQSLSLDDPRTQAFAARMGEAMAGATSLADLAKRFSTVAGIPDEIRGQRGDAELEAVGKALSVIRLPTPEQIRELVGAVAANNIPLLTVSGGWNPGIDASSERAAERDGGRHVLIESPHHFPQNHDPEGFNAVFTEFMTEAEARA
jgi:pimeloyl-ACP methyl ester carboxylesterase